jgi:hypothetical protein
MKRKIRICSAANCQYGVKALTSHHCLPTGAEPLTTAAVRRRGSGDSDGQHQLFLHDVKL